MQRPSQITVRYYKKSMQGTENIIILTPNTTTRIIRTSVFTAVLIVFACFLVSCDAPRYVPVLDPILRKLKFRVAVITAGYPARLDRYDVLFLHALDKAPTETEIRGIQNFVNTGGTLIVAGDNEVLADLYLAYGLELQKLTKRMIFSQRMSEEALFRENPVDEIRTATDKAIEPFGREAAVLFARENDAAIVTLRDGEGRAYFIASDYMFTRDGFRYSGNAAFLYNLVSTFPHNAHIGLAQRRYYTLETKPPDPFMSLIFRTPGGLAAVYICLMLFVFLVLRGRRFGRPLDAQEKNRRLSSEYVHAMTALYQKGSTRTDILKHIRNKFRTDLATRWRVNPNVDTDTFLEELTSRGAMDEDNQLTNLIMDLEASANISEAQLRDLAHRVEAYRELAKINRRKSLN